MPKIGFFGFIGKFSHEFFLNLVYKESSFYLLYSCTNPIHGKDLVAHFLHADTNLRKLKVTLIIIRWTWSKVTEAYRSRDS